MSVSSGSDITIPIQDSPPPPPSPYQNNRIDPTELPSTSSLPVTMSGLINNGFQDIDLREQSPPSSGKLQTEIPMTDYTTMESSVEDSFKPPTSESSRFTEAVNTELVNNGMNVLDTIPHKPQPEFGPYEKFPDYFISVNQHKKLFTRGEKLSVTKDKRVGSGKWKKVLCWTLGGFLVVATITIAVLAAVGVIPEKTQSSGGTFSMREMTTTFGTTTTELPSSADELYSSTSSNLQTVKPIVNDNFVPNSAVVEFTFPNQVFTESLHNSSTGEFRVLATEIEDNVKQYLQMESEIDLATARVLAFSNGSVVAKLRIGWGKLQFGDETLNFDQVQELVSKWTRVGNFTLRSGTTVLYHVRNECKFNNYGCSNSCAFDEGSLDFVCTCPEDKLLGVDGKNCVDPSTKVPVFSTTEFSTTTSEDTMLLPEPEASPSPSDILEVTPEPMTTPYTSSSLATTEPSTPSTTITIEIQPDLITPEDLHSTESDASSTPGTEESEPTAEVVITMTTSSTTDHPHSEETEGHHEFFTEGADKEETTVAPEIVSDLPKPTVTVSTTEDLVTPTATTTTEIYVPSDPIISDSFENVDANPSTSTSTASPVVSSLETSNETIRDSEHHSSFETESGSREEEGITILPATSPENSEETETLRNSSYSRAFNSEEVTMSSIPTRPISSSDEIMVYSDVHPNVGEENVTKMADSVTETHRDASGSEENVSEMGSTEESEETRHSNGGQMQSFERMVQGDSELRPLNFNVLPAEREVEEYTTPQAINLENDTLVNEMNVNPTQETNSETVQPPESHGLASWESDTSSSEEQILETPTERRLDPIVEHITTVASAPTNMSNFEAVINITPTPEVVHSDPLIPVTPTTEITHNLEPLTTVSSVADIIHISEATTTLVPDSRIDDSLEPAATIIPDSDGPHVVHTITPIVPSIDDIHISEQVTNAPHLTDSDDVHLHEVHTTTSPASNEHHNSETVTSIVPTTDNLHIPDVQATPVPYSDSHLVSENISTPSQIPDVTKVTETSDNVGASTMPTPAQSQEAQPTHQDTVPVTSTVNSSRESSMESSELGSVEHPVPESDNELARVNS